MLTILKKARHGCLKSVKVKIDVYVVKSLIVGRFPHTLQNKKA
jgi:hypothetical protein